MRGEIVLSNSSAQGTIFSFDVPAISGQIPAPEAEQMQRRPIALAPEQSPYRILVVEDKWENRQLLVKLLGTGLLRNDC